MMHTLVKAMENKHGRPMTAEDIRSLRRNCWLLFMTGQTLVVTLGVTIFLAKMWGTAAAVYSPVVAFSMAFCERLYNLYKLY